MGSMGGDERTRQETTYGYDPKATQALYQMGTRNWNFYKKHIRPYEKEAIAGAREMIPLQTEAGVRLILRYTLGKMTVKEERPELLPAIA